ncbi:MAG: hypothetical protein ACREVD_16690 [Burkholderiales bacterium]
MFYLARLISTSCRSLSATIGFAVAGVLGRNGAAGWPEAAVAADLPPRNVPAIPLHPPLLAATPDPGVISPFLIDRRTAWTAENS